MKVFVSPDALLGDFGGSTLNVATFRGASPLVHRGLPGSACRWQPRTRDIEIRFLLPYLAVIMVVILIADFMQCLVVLSGMDVSHASTQEVPEHDNSDARAPL
jgi:hypothetical protein